MDGLRKYSTIPRRGWTLVELLTAIGIFVVLSGALLFGGNMVRNARRTATAKQQLALIASTIDQYASFWPQWKAGAISVSDKGWPDFIPGRVFGSCTNGVGPYETTVGFNDTVMLSTPSWIDNGVLVLSANTCLSFQLLAASGKGPYLRDREGANLKDAAEFAPGATRILYPGFDSTCTPGGAAKTAEIMTDPWGTPLRYFWVYRDASGTAYRGYLPVDFGPVLGDAGPYGVQNAEFQQAASTVPQTAAGYVLESAGPDKKFGNVWKINPTAAEIEGAEDNKIISP